MHNLKPNTKRYQFLKAFNSGEYVIQRTANTIFICLQNGKTADLLINVKLYLMLFTKLILNDI